VGETKPTILIVDDTPTNIETLDEVLEDRYEILVATDGRRALEVAVGEKPDLVLLDIVMPGMDGFEVCRRLKSDPATWSIPVIFITAMSEVADEAAGLEVGAIDYIIKPFSPPIVRARVRNHLELKRHRDLLEHLSEVDGLTGIANRRRFDSSLASEWQRGTRSRSSLALLMLDVDEFKAYNDYYGHADGDQCLRRIAATMRGALRRPADLAARYGGEEFAGILPDTDMDAAAGMAERIRAGVEELAISHDRSWVAPVVTVSIGVASAVPRSDHEPLSLVARADVHLYRAKRSGCNRVCVEESDWQV